jgi:outer membrane receptor protein involved in Fe transport
LEDAETGALRHDESTAINLRSTFIAIDPFVGLKNTENASHDIRMRLQMSDNAFPDAPQNESLALSMLTEYQAWFNLIPGVNINTGLFQNASRIESLFFGNHTAQNLAAYLQTDVSLGQKLKMVGGFRIEHNSLNGESDKLIPLFRAGINYMAHSYTFLRASYGQGYRYPSIAEKHAATTLGAIRIFPNLLLQPESGWNAELGAKQGIVIHGWDGMVDLALFYSQNKDLIEYLFGIYPDPVSGISMAGFRADNTEYSRVYGAETEFMFMRKTGSFEHNISGGYLYTLPVEFNQNTGKNLDTYLKYRRKHSAKLSLSTRYGKLEPGVDIFFRSKMLNIDDIFLRQINGVEILPGFNQYWSNNNNSYVLVDFSMAYHFSQQYKLSAAIKNLTNKEYMGRPGDIRPHRNFSIRLSVLF